MSLGRTDPCRLRVACAPQTCTVGVKTPGTAPTLLTLEAGIQLLVARPQASLWIERGVPTTTLDANRLCRLLAFVDTALAANLPADAAAQPQPRPVVPPVVQPALHVITLPPGVHDNPAMLERWLLHGLLGRGPCAILHAELRRREPYALVRYLLDAETQGRSLKALGERYGLSDSHFRRLCNKTLGGPVKVRVNAWRAARIALALLDRDRSIAFLATEFGYASPSHITHNLKRCFGMTPSQLRSIGRQLAAPCSAGDSDVAHRA